MSSAPRLLSGFAALAVLLCAAAADAQDTPLLSAPQPVQAAQTTEPMADPAPASPSLHPTGESAYPIRAPIGNLLDLQVFGEGGYKQTDWFRKDYDYESFSTFLETRLLATNVPVLAKAYVEPFLRTVFSGNSAAADGLRDPFYENVFLYGVGVGWRPIRLLPPPPSDGSGRATLYDWVEPLRVYAEKDWWVGLRGDFDPLPSDDWRVGIDYYRETRSVGEPHHDRLWAEIFWDLRWHDTNFFANDFQDVVFSSTVKAGVNWPYIGEQQALQPYLALDVNASGNDYYLFNRASGGAGLRITTDLPLGGESRSWTLRTRWFAEYQHEIGYFHERVAVDGDSPPGYELRFGLSFSLNRY
ncbi:MAG: hypothetical protein HZA54_01970 [Planctomycetes bacterium]|nr:hypothetical protein [Planctomycetota bacterium]